MRYFREQMFSDLEMHISFFVYMGYCAEADYILQISYMRTDCEQ